MSNPVSPSSALGVYNSSLPTWTDGQTSELQTDVNGRLLTLDSAALTVLGTVSDAKVTNPDAATATVDGLLRGILNALTSTLPVQTYVSNSYVNITTKTTTVVKASPGVLDRIIINKTGTTDTLAIYDNTAGSGTLVGTINTPTIGMNFVYSATMATGITIVSGGGTAGDYTVIYR